MVLKQEELLTISGGFKSTIWGLIGVATVFVASVIYGIIYPDKC